MLVKRSLILTTQGLAEAMKPQSETGLTGSTYGPLFRMPKRRFCSWAQSLSSYLLRCILAMRRSASAFVADCLSVGRFLDHASLQMAMDRFNTHRRNPKRRALRSIILTLS